MYKLINNDETLLKFQEVLQKEKPIIGFDTETTGLFPKTDICVGFSFSWKPGYAAYVPVNHMEGQNVSREAAINFLRSLKNLKVVFHNASFDKQVVLCSFGVLLDHYADTMIYAYLNNDPKGLKDLSFKYLNKDQVKFEDLMRTNFGSSWNKLGYTFGHLDPSSLDALSYACEDADNTLSLFEILYPKMSEYKTVLKIEENVIDPTIKLNLTGCVIDKDMLNKATIDYEKELEELYEDITEIAGRKVLLNSTRDLPKFLFEELRLPVITRSAKTGAPSTSAEVLEELSDLHPVVSKIDKWRKNSRLLKGYIKKLPDGLDENNRFYSNFNSTGAVSGRYTSSSIVNSQGVTVGTNLQNIPRKKGRAIDMRAAFIAPEGWTFVKADYSQIEYRVMASLAKDNEMIAAFNRGVDFHTFAAAMMYDISQEEVTPAQRDNGKVFNFGLSYGMTPMGLATRLGCSEEEAKNKIDVYFSRLPNLVALINATKQRALVEGATHTFFGRKRILSLENLPQRAHDQVLRRSFNTMIQGTAADILKIGIIRLYHNLLKGNKNIQFVLTVHDELCFLVKDEYLKEYLPIIRRSMEVPTPDTWAPIVAEVEYGVNWSSESHTKYEDESYEPEPFTGWKNILPPNLKCSADDIEDIL